MVVRMRHNRSQTGNTRSHHALKPARLSKCQDCGHMHLRHSMCQNCGKYMGVVVVDVHAKMEKKEARRKARLKERGEEVKKAETETADVKKS
ncbi:MAG TPA: 50S ribosomal protein L32 [Candidatus Paceibacterota bacterium]